LRIVNEAAGRIRLRVEGAAVHMDARDGLDEVVATMLAAMLDGTWSRLKACRNCHWSFYDYSPNRSATWCSMQLCGNRAKTRAYRKRRTRSR
jgi:predicted RNA-binding Zn ribbon-like protein